MPDSSLKYCLPSRLRFVLFLHLAAAVAGAAVDLSSVPKPTGYVSDLANVLNASDKADLETFCTKVEAQLGAQFAIVTIKTLGDTPIEDFGLELGRQWGVGPKGKNEGLLMLLAIQDHKQRIEVGRGLEAYITDSFAGDTARAMQPLLRTGNYGGALKQGALALAQQVAQGKNVAFSETLPLPQRPVPQQDDNSFGTLIPIALFVGVFLLIAFLNRRGGGGGRGSGVGTGFWAGLLLNSLLSSGRGGRSGSGWGGGGGFGGDSGGGGGFGGFGGGDFGGGGASSDW